jgi:hypothetical protein
MRPQTQLFEGWQAGKSLFVVTSLQWSLHPGCTAALKRQEADGSLVVVEAPGLGCNSGGVAASVGGRLLLLGFPFGPQQASGSLRWYNPATGKVRILYKAKSGTPGVVWLDPFGSNAEQDLLLES